MRETPLVLTVDDEPHVLDFLRISLTRQGLQVVDAVDGAQALERLRDEMPDLVLLDLGLPDCDGLTVLEEMRAESGVPIIVVTVRSDEADKIRGLELGADDYVTKPFSPSELGARIKAVLRRAGGTGPAPLGLMVVDEYLQIDFDERQAIVGGQRVHLRPTEYRLLYHLVRHAGRTLAFSTILERVWGAEYQQETHYVHLYVTYLRQKLEPDPSNPRYILTRRGLGYQFCPVASTGMPT
jgi:two-component system KDP operon response regulator KdpE